VPYHACPYDVSVGWRTFCATSRKGVAVSRAIYLVFVYCYKEGQTFEVLDYEDLCFLECDAV
jgi:hypothetical protein